MSKYTTTCAIIVNAQNKVLLIKRAREPFKNIWALISGIGGSKKGFEPQEAVKDEVYYDLHVPFQGKFVFSLSVKNDQFTDEILVFQGTINEINIRLNPISVSEFGWFRKEDIKNLGSLAFEHNVILEMISLNISSQTN